MTFYNKRLFVIKWPKFNSIQHKMLLNMNIFHLSGTQWWPGRPDHELLPAGRCQEEEPWVHLPPASDITSWQQWTAPSPCWHCSDVHTAHWQHSEEGKKEKATVIYLMDSCITFKTTHGEQEDAFSFSFSIHTLHSTNTCRPEDLQRLVHLSNPQRTKSQVGPELLFCSLQLPP